ncbi:hypothetical protein TNCV_1124761 [Trichonephila clavipes]|uniref:Uncharacterized protein n=1 Tax=Trichonephila clavipes TaxID=2585209 RepID=A0A8X6VLQ4_TRICX|nr:hypothetical protein TNCV_1124761 [Trichonephila clavipes]
MASLDETRVTKSMIITFGDKFYENIISPRNQRKVSFLREISERREKSSLAQKSSLFSTCVDFDQRLYPSEFLLVVLFRELFLERCKAGVWADFSRIWATSNVFKVLRCTQGLRCGHSVFKWNVFVS